MATYSKQFLSGNVGGGRAKKVVGTVSGTADTVHTTLASQAVIDEVWLWVYNSDTVDRIITVQKGGTTSPDDEMKFTVPAQLGWVPLVSGLLLQGDGANGRSVKVYGEVANVLTIDGFVNRIA